LRVRPDDPVVQIEKKFKIRFSTGELVGLNNVGELLALIDRLRTR
jgi:acyl carrier protein